MYSMENHYWGIKIDEIDRYSKKELGIEIKISRTTKWRILKELCEMGLIKLNEKTYRTTEKLQEYKKQWIRNNHTFIRKYLKEWDEQHEY